MTKHYNQTIVEDAARILNSKMDYLSDEVSGPVAVIPITRYANVVKTTTRSTTGTSTIFTTPTDKDFYLTYAMIAFNCDATADVVEVLMNVTIEGVAISRILSIRKNSLATASNQQSQNFTVPIKIDRGTAISVNQVFTVGTCVCVAAIAGYTVETTK